jgi:modification methylase
MSTIHTIINGDSRRMHELADESIHLIITSPPYWQLKDYGSENQLGYNESYESYINNLNLVWDESFRVLHKGCRLCINIGDQFARAVYYGRYKVIPIRTEIIKFCESRGFDYMGAIIWQKVTTSNTTGGATVMGSFPYPRNGILKIDYEFILFFKKPGTSPKPNKEFKKESAMTKEEWNTYFQGHWNFSGVRQDNHLAMFPEELPKRLIKMFSFVGDNVLDPFLGSGTTSLAAKNLERNSFGYEINPEFIPIIKNKLSISEKNIFDNNTYKFVSKEIQNINYEKDIAKLSYIFRDPHSFDKKVDPKKLQFGSRLDKNSVNREEYYSIKEVISSEKLKLNNDLIIKLIGIREKTEVNGKAREFLINKTKGQKVFLKFDKHKYDNKDYLLCYLYLQNKTFINAHLIKNQLAEVDTTYNYKLLNKFLSLQKEDDVQ